MWRLKCLLWCGRREGLKALYRVVFDAMEEWTTLMADDVLVNSRFTAAAFKSTFRRLVEHTHTSDSDRRASQRACRSLAPCHATSAGASAAAIVGAASSSTFSH